MGLTVNTNILSLNAQKNIGRVHNNLARAVERLSSGLRINSAKDDAAGLSISMKLSAHIRSINQAVRNAQDGISLVQTAEGGMAEIHNILVRMRELAEQAANGTLGTSERAALDNEFQSLKQEITRISDTTEFNGRYLINGGLSANGVDLQVGFQNTAQDRINVDGATLDDIDATALDLTGGTQSSIETQLNAQSMLTLVDSAISTVSTRRGDLGAIQNRLSHTIANLQVAGENYSAANARIVDADFAVESANLTRAQIIIQAGVSVLAQANVLPQYALQLLG